jgi:hypothetical protein
VSFERSESDCQSERSKINSSEYRLFSVRATCIVNRIMPFPSDQQVMETASGVVTQLKTAFGSHPGFRPGRIIVTEDS